MIAMTFFAAKLFGTPVHNVHRRQPKLGDNVFQKDDLLLRAVHERQIQRGRRDLEWNTGKARPTADVDQPQRLRPRQGRA